MQEQRTTEEIEKILTDIWHQLLEIEEISPEEDFFELGGDSLLAGELLTEIEQKLGVDLSIDTIINNCTIQNLTMLISGDESMFDDFRFVKPVNPKGLLPPLFCIHNLDGDAICYRQLSVCLGKEQPVYGLVFNPECGLFVSSKNITDLACLYIQEMLMIQPKGPYFMAGHSLGGLIAYEIARQLADRKEEVALLAMFDTWLPAKMRKLTFIQKAKESYHKYSEISFVNTLSYLRKHAIREIERNRKKFYGRHNYEEKKEKYNHKLLTVSTLEEAVNAYRPQPYEGTITYFNANKNETDCSKRSLPQLAKLAAIVEVDNVDCTHEMMLTKPAVAELAEKLRIVLQTARQKYKC